MVNEQHNQGAPASPSGRREPDPQAVPALRASVPSAARWTFPPDCIPGLSFGRRADGSFFTTGV